MTKNNSIKELIVKAFKSSKDFRSWLRKNHLIEREIWIRIFKAGSGVTTVTYSEALDEALCFGWIDARKMAYDENSWLQRFCPRRPKSMWSKMNTERAERLIRSKKMTRFGLKLINEAKKDGRWKAAYDSPKTSEIPSDFLIALKLNKKASLFFKTLDRANIYAIVYRLQTAKKPETRKARMNKILDMLERREKFHKSKRAKRNLKN